MPQHYDLTKSQFLIWMGQQLKPESPIYNMAFAFHFTEKIDAAIFQQSFEQLVQDVEVLRSRLVVVEEMPKMTFVSHLDYDLPIIDLSEQAASKIENWMTERSQRMFDLQERLFDSALLRVAPDQYIWYLNQHHLITDGWSIGLLYRLFSDIYYQNLNGTTSLNAEIPSYRSFLEQKVSATSHLKNQTYWKEKLKTLDDPTPFYSKTNNKHSSLTKRTLFTLDKATTKGLRDLTMDKEIRTWTASQSLFTIFCTIYAILIYRLTGEKKVVFGTPAHGRSDKQLQQTIGLFIKIFPLAVTVEETDTFKMLYFKLRNEINSFLKHQQGVDTSAELNHTFNAILNYINVPIQKENSIPSTADWLHTGHIDPGHHIRFQVYDFNDTGNFTISFDLNTAVFNRTLREIVIDQFKDLLQLFVEDKDLSISSITPAEQQKIETFNQTERDYPTSATIPQLFEQQVLKTPNQVAILFEDAKMTYRELNEKSNQVAHYLLSKDVKKEDRVAICVERSLEMMVGLLGILKAGAAYVPIDPEYPKERIQYIIEDAKAAYVLTFPKFESLVEHIDDLEVIDLYDAAFKAHSTKNPIHQATIENLMYVIYTSGSTGRPKGVMNQYSGVLNRLRWGMDTYEFKPSEDLLMQKTNYCFDVSVPELFLPIIFGVPLLFAHPDGHKDSIYLKNTIDTYGVTSIHFVPPMLEVFLLSIAKNDCPSLKRVFCSGEALKVSQVLEFKRLLPNVALHNLYGPTEAAVEVAIIQMLPNNNPIKQVPIGKPVPNTKLYILDKKDRLCPIGVPGELHISGIQVARGYFKNEDLTAKVFVTNPYGTDSYQRMYKTGDLAYWLPDGNIAFLGRKDFQIKIRGFRVELEEIEAALDELPYIHQSVVLARDNEAGIKNLVAYIAVENPIDIAEIQQYLRAKLPDYMIPTFFVPLKQIPVNFNEKIDRKALLAMEVSDSSTGTVKEQPTNDFESMIKDIWMEVLDMEMGIKDSFFALGGDSLTAIKVILRMNKAFELQLPVNIIFQYPTIGSLGAYVEKEIMTFLAEMD